MVRSDSGSQYTSTEFQNFAKTWNFEHGAFGISCFCVAGNFPLSRLFMSNCAGELTSFIGVFVVNYYPRYFEIAQLENISSKTVITHFKSIFARHGIPSMVRSDSGSQYTSLCAREVRVCRTGSLAPYFSNFCALSIFHILKSCQKSVHLNLAGQYMKFNSETIYPRRMARK
jgi:hypothetical protein